MNKLTLDTESTTFQKGAPFARRNRLCAVSLKQGDNPAICLPWEYNDPVTADIIQSLESALNEADLLIFFNAKRDLHWLRRCGIIKDYKLESKRIWDCQAVQFIIRNQSERYPSLNSSCEFFGLGQKIDVIERDYWSKGIDTPNVPWNLLAEYAALDAELTYKLYISQLKYLEERPELLQLCRLVCMDTLILAEMEFNGLKLDSNEAIRRAEQTEKAIQELESELRSMVDAKGLNFNSPEHISCILYGGVVRYTESTPYAHTYKGGQKAGLTETRYTHKKVEVQMPRLVQPLPKTELKKEGYWSTDDGVLRRLRATGRSKRVIELITKRNELERLASTYYRGLPETINEQDWEPGELHGQFNQTTVITGRLSSSSPNLQNVPPEANELIKTRF